MLELLVSKCASSFYLKTPKMKKGRENFFSRPFFSKKEKAVNFGLLTAFFALYVILWNHFIQPGRPVI